MIFIILTIVVIILMVCFDVPHMWKDKLKKELWASSILLLIGIALSICFALNIEIPSPLELMKIIYQPISDWFFQGLQ